MKILSRSVVLFLASYCPLAISSVSANNLVDECVTSFDSNIDYFPDKVTVEESAKWTVSYEKSYKVVSNLAADATYVLYQCGTDPPILDSNNQMNGKNVSSVIPIPIQFQQQQDGPGTIGISMTPIIPYLELLGLRTNIGAYFGDNSVVTSPCLLSLMEDGAVSLIEDGTKNATQLAASNIDTEHMVSFVSFQSSSSPMKKEVAFSEFEEKTVAAMFEWIKYLSLFTNTEALANNVYGKAMEEYDCIATYSAENMNMATSDNSEYSKPVVLWAYYSDYCMGWSVGECPNYYCDFASACSAELLHSPTEGSVTDGPCEQYGTYLTTEELVELGKDADHWIYPAPNWDDTFAANEDALSQMRSVQTEQVYDYQGSGSNAWFEQRFAEFDNVLLDFCTVVDTSPPIHRRVWFRDVFNEPIGTEESCDDPTAMLQVDSQCIGFTTSTNTEDDEGTVDDKESAGEEGTNEEEGTDEEETTQEDQSVSDSGSMKITMIQSVVMTMLLVAVVVW